MTFSKSGKFVAYGISKSGSDWSTIYFRETSKPFVDAAADERSSAAGGPDRLSDKLEFLKYSHPVWTHDDEGVFYMRFPEPSSKKTKDGKEVEASDTDASETGDHGTSTDASQHAALYYHKMGSSQKEDVLVVARDEKVATSMFSSAISTDGKWLIISHSIDTDTKSRIYVASLAQPIGPDMKWICLVPKFEYQLSFMINKGNHFYFVSNKDAPNSKIVRVEVDPTQAKTVHHITEMTEEARYEDVIEEDKAAPIRDVTIVNNDKLLIVYSKDVKDELWQFELHTGERLQRLLPDFVGTINGVSGRWLDDEVYVTAASFVNPGIVTRLSWPSDSNPRAEPRLLFIGPPMSRESILRCTKVSRSSSPARMARRSPSL
jgi:prolyl oligopeptidase